jgi:hypothetical protein
MSHLKVHAWTDEQVKSRATLLPLGSGSCLSALYLSAQKLNIPNCCFAVVSFVKLGLSKQVTNVARDYFKIGC